MAAHQAEQSRAEHTRLLELLGASSPGSEGFLRCETGSAGGGRELFSSPFHFSRRMKEVLRLLQAASSSTPSVTRL